LGNPHPENHRELGVETLHPALAAEGMIQATEGTIPRAVGMNLGMNLAAAAEVCS
jgi:hypothetical protein